MLLSDVLSVAYVGPKSRTERYRKTKIGMPRHRWLGHHFQGQRSTHQAALLSAALTREAGAENVLGVGKNYYIASVCLVAREVLGHPQGRRGPGAYYVITRTRTACSSWMQLQFVIAWLTPLVRFCGDSMRRRRCLVWGYQSRWRIYDNDQLCQQQTRNSCRHSKHFCSMFSASVSFSLYAAR